MHNNHAPSTKNRRLGRHQPDPHAALRRLNKQIRRWNSPRPIPTRALATGAIVWAEIPFVDGSGAKSRPAVLIDLSGATVSVRPVTSSLRRHRRLGADTELSGWAEAGLSRPSAVQSRTIELDRSAVSDVIGTLAMADRRRVIGGEPNAE